MIALVAGCAGQLPLIPSGAPEPSPAAPDSFLVTFQTTKGPFSVMARRPWAPRGVDRFYDLVQRGFYNGVTVYRVVDGFVAQFGHTDSAAVNAAWRGRTLEDEPVRAENTSGRVAFARSGPGSRNYQLYINTGNNSPRLDTISSQGLVGFPPIAEVVQGLETVLAFESRWGDEPSTHQDSIAAFGGAYLNRAYPGLDRILSATVVRRW